MSPKGFKKNFAKTDGYKQTTLVSYFSSQKFLKNRVITSEGETNNNLCSASFEIENNLGTTSIHSSSIMTSERKLARETLNSTSFAQSQEIINDSEGIKSTEQYQPKLPVPIIPYKASNITSQVSKTPKKMSCGFTTPKKTKLSPKKERFSPMQKSSIENATIISVLKNIVDSILSQSRFRGLLAADEERQIKIFLNMNRFYQFFLCKLVTRKYSWYNIFKLAEDLKMNMTESEIRKMYDELKEINFIKTDYSTEDLSFLLKLLLKKDVVDICKTFRVSYKDIKKEEIKKKDIKKQDIKEKNIKKQDLINRLLSTVNHQQSYFSVKSGNQILRENVNKMMGCCVKLDENLYNLLYKFYVLYFLTDFSLCVNISDWNYLIFQIEQGETIYPEFKVDEEFIIFTNKEEFEEYAKSYAHYQSALIANNKKEIVQLLSLCKAAAQGLSELLERNSKNNWSPNVKMFSAGHVYAQTISSNIEYLLCKYPKDTYQLVTCLLGQNLYKQSKRGYWYEKLAWIEWKYFENHEQAVHTLIRGLKDKTINDVAKHDLSQLGRKFKKIKKVNLPNSVYDEICWNVIDPPEHVPFKEVVISAVTERENESGKKRKYIVKNSDGERTYMTVEDVAYSHYYRNGFPNITKCEGKFLVSLYRLCFWDIIYDSSIKGVFISKLQMYPLDFYSKQFYENRKIKIDQRLEDIEMNWTKNYFKEFLNNICQSDSLALKLSEFVENSAQLCEIIWCIGRQKFAKICKRFVDEFYLFNSGLPDLFMWSVETQRAKFVEVKGEGDRLSTKQVLWLDFFRSIEVDAEVCYVHSTGSRGGKKYKKKLCSKSPTSQC